MAYTVNKTNSSASPSSYTVSDSVVNTQTNLSFIGKGYAGYGETIAENFLHLLENFSNTSAPTKPIVGQLWWDSTNASLKVYNGSAFVEAGGTAPYQASAPSTLTSGDMWVDSDTKQLYFYDGSASVLVGPPSATGTSQGFIYDTILDSADASKNITKWYVDGTLVAIVSDETAFTPKTTITGFASVKKGITLTTADTDIKFQGTATDADALGGVAAANYLRTNANDTTSGTLGIVTDSGMTVGADNDISITVDSSGAIISNTVSNTDITFKVNDGGTTTTVMSIDGSESRVGIGTTTPTTKLDVSGTVNATAFTGPLTGAVTGNVTGDVTGSAGTASTVTAVDADTTTVSNIEVDNFKASAIVTEAEGIGSNDNDTTIPTSAAIKDYVDARDIGDLTVIGSTISAQSNADLSLQPGGTGAVVLHGVRVSGTEISSDDSTQVTVRDGLTVTGAVVMMRSLPTSDPSNAGQLWNSSGDLKISAG